MTEDSPDDSDHAQRSSGAAWVWFGLFTFASYPLSTGPAVWCMEYFQLTGTAAETLMKNFYLPINMLVSWSGPEGVVYKWIFDWLEFWQELAGT